jgi:hypothetical protein
VINSLRDATREQLGAEIAAKLTKRELLILAVGAEKISSTPERVYGEDGQITEETTVETDVETGETRTQHVTWSYYKTGEVDVIEIIVLDTNGKIAKQKKIKHYVDGREPEVMA